MWLTLSLCAAVVTADTAMLTIEGLADWPSSAEHWSDIPGWPAGQWGKWAEGGAQEGAQPAKRKVNAVTNPSEQAGNNAGFFGSHHHNLYKHVPHAGNNQNSNGISGGAHYGFYQPNNQYQTFPEAKELLDSRNPHYPIKYTNVFAGVKDNIVSTGNYQKINFPNPMQQKQYRQFYGHNIPEVDTSQGKSIHPKQNIFLENSENRFTNPFKRNTNKAPMNSQVENGGYSSVKPFNSPQRNFQNLMNPNKNFGLQVPQRNVLRIEPIKITPPNFNPKIAYKTPHRPAFIAKNNFKRRAPGRFYTPYIPVVKKPVNQDTFDDGDFSDIVEISDKEFANDFGKFSNEAFKVMEFDAENNDTDYKDDFFNDPGLEDFDFEEFETFEYEKEKRKGSNQHNNDLIEGNTKSADVNQFKRDNIKDNKMSNKDRNLDFNYSTEGLEMFKKNKYRKPTYKDPYRKPDSKKSPLKKGEYDPEKDFEPLFDFSDPVGGFGSDFTGGEFEFGSDDETADHARTSHHNDYQEDYEKTDYNDYNEIKSKEMSKKENGYFHDKTQEFDQDKEYLDKVFAEFEDKYKDIDKNLENRRISHNSKKNENTKKSEETSKLITEPFKQTNTDRADKYQYVHQKLMTDDHWEKMNTIPDSDVDKTNSDEFSEDEANYEDFTFSNKKGK